MSDPIRILIADDHQLVRQGFKALLSVKDGFEIVGQAADGDEAVRMALSLKPDIILMDLLMPRKTGIEATREIKKLRPGLPVIAATATTFEDEEAACREAGCEAFITKPLQFRKLFELMQSFFDRQK